MSYKSILLTAMTLSAPLLAGVLPENAVVGRMANSVDVLQVKGLQIVNQLVSPQTQTSAAHTSAILEMSVQVEGNLCLDDAGSLEMQRARTDGFNSRLSLSVSSAYDPYHPTGPMACAQFSAPRTLKVPVNLQDYYFKDEPNKDYNLVISQRMPSSTRFEDVTLVVHARPDGYQVEIQK